MHRFDLAGVRSGIARVAGRLRAESARLPSLARSRAGGNSISRTVIGFAIVTAESIASLLSARLGAFRSWRGTPPFRRDPKAACQIDFPPARMLLLAVLLLGVVEPRFAHGAEDEGPREKQAEVGPPPVDRESGASHQGIPSPVSDARPRGLSDALYMHVGIDLPALDATTIRTMRLQYGPDWLGPHRTLPESAAAELPGTWGLTVDGEPIWRVTIRSAQAAAIAIRFETFDADGEVWIYTHDGEAYAGPYSGGGARQRRVLVGSAARGHADRRILPPPPRDWGNEASVPDTQDLASCAVGAAQVGRVPIDSATLADSRQRGTEFPNPLQGCNLQLGVSAAWRPRPGAVGRCGGDDGFAPRHWLVPMHRVRPQEPQGTRQDDTAFVLRCGVY